jgi:predicted HTH transcriptional regulator
MSGAAMIICANRIGAPHMGHPTLSSDQIRQRNDEILAYADQHPKTTNVTLAEKYGLNRETIRVIVEKGRQQAIRNQRLAGKARKWGLSDGPKQPTPAPE